MAQDIAFQSLTTRGNVPVSADNPLPVTLPDGASVSGIGATTDLSVSDPTASATLVSATKGTNELIAELLAINAGAGAYTVIAGNGTSNAIVNGPGTLLAVVITKKGASSNTLDLYDGLTNAGTPLGTIDTTDRVGPITYGPSGLRFGTGLTAVMATGTAASATLLYRAD